MTDEKKALSCSLDPIAMAKRAMAWRRVNKARIEWRREDGRSTSLYAGRPGVADDLQRLVDLERECCGFLTFTLRPEGENVRLDVEAPESSPELLGAF